MQNALIFGVFLTALVTYLFLGSIGTTINVCVSIPTSLIGTFLAISLCGYTLNFMTLLAMSLSVGVVVDDAILVLENIYRRREHGQGKYEAALQRRTRNLVRRARRHAFDRGHLRSGCVLEGFDRDVLRAVRGDDDRRGPVVARGGTDDHADDVLSLF